MVKFTDVESRRKEALEFDYPFLRLCVGVVVNLTYKKDI